jgi:hypothetical protein
VVLLNRYAERAALGRLLDAAQTVKDALAAWHAGYDYYNFAETPASASAVLPRDSYHRLQMIKASYDPDQAIISAHPVCDAFARHRSEGRQA